MKASNCERRSHRRIKITRPHRREIVFTPSWEGPIQSWAFKFIHKNRWRCDAIHEFDDLVQDAYLCFVKVRERYPRVVSPQQFMSLFRTTFTNQIHDHSRYMKRKRVVHADTHTDVSDLCTGLVGDLNNDGYVSAVLASAPEHLKRAITLVTQDHPDLHLQYPKGKRQNLNQKVGRILGIEGFRFADELRALLTH